MKLLAVLLLFFSLCYSAFAAIAYDDFEDHLAMMNKENESGEESQANFHSSEKVEEESSGDGFMVTTTADPRPMSCCDIGRIAGVGGFHCNPEYYKPRMQMRNMNRPHNMKLGFHGGDERDHKYSLGLMKQFRKCVGGLSSRLENEFHKCCKYAYIGNQSGGVSSSEVDSSSRSNEKKEIDSSSRAARRRYKFKYHRIHGDREAETSEEKTTVAP